MLGELPLPGSWDCLLSSEFTLQAALGWHHLWHFREVGVLELAFPRVKNRKAARAEPTDCFGPFGGAPLLWSRVTVSWPAGHTCMAPSTVPISDLAWLLA